jgi:hypothetical protein
MFWDASFVVVSFSAAMFERNLLWTDVQQLFYRWDWSKRTENKGQVIDLHEGTKVYVKSWRSLEKVQLTDGTVGWIDSEAIREVK